MDLATQAAVAVALALSMDAPPALPPSRPAVVLPAIRRPLAQPVHPPQVGVMSPPPLVAGRWLGMPTWGGVFHHPAPMFAPPFGGFGGGFPNCGPAG